LLAKLKLWVKSFQKVTWKGQVAKYKNGNSTLQKQKRTG